MPPTNLRMLRLYNTLLLPLRPLAALWFLRHRGLTMIEGRYPLGFKIRLHQKDLAICADMASDKGARLPLVEMTRIHYERLMSRGLGDHDISALFVLKKELFPEQEE